MGSTGLDGFYAPFTTKVTYLAFLGFDSETTEFQNKPPMFKVSERFGISVWVERLFWSLYEAIGFGAAVCYPSHPGYGQPPFIFFVGGWSPISIHTHFFLGGVSYVDTRPDNYNHSKHLASCIEKPSPGSSSGSQPVQIVVRRFTSQEVALQMVFPTSKARPGEKKRVVVFLPTVSPYTESRKTTPGITGS